MDRITFRTEPNGYDQMEVLTRLDALEEIKEKLRKGKLTQEDAAQQARTLIDQPIPTRASGMAVQEVENYFENFLSQIYSVCNNAEARRAVLSMAFIGYDKMQTLMVIDLLNALLIAVEDGIKDPAEAVASAEQTLKTPLKTKLFGFSVAETDRFLDRLMQKLRSYC